MINQQEQNWTNLFDDITSEGIAWHGIWTMYSPNQEITKTYRGVRNFQANDDKTLITHSNYYTYADGSTEEKIWQIEKQACNHPDGVAHPAILSMRALSFKQGAKAWISKTLEVGKNFGVELFFRHQDWRTSVGSIYDEAGNLQRIFHIREHRGSFSDQVPSSAVKTISGEWIGKKESITPDLQLSSGSEYQELTFPVTRGKNETLFLPDGVMLNIPKCLRLGEGFELIGGKFFSDSDYRKLTAIYNESGEFVELVSEVFHRKD
ncbi:MAG TPA: DUF3598 family protein [Coleofasciculaceae cyanobacterium]